MLTSILFFLKRAFYFVIDHWKIVLPAIGLLILVVFLYRACQKPPHLNEAEIQKAEIAVKEHNDKVLKDILVESDVREKQIDANVANAEKTTQDAILESKQRYQDLSSDELAAEIERRKN